MLFAFVVVILIVILLVIFSLNLDRCPSHPNQSGGSLSPLAGPVNLLQAPKGLLMDGYRFQDTLFAPYPLKTTSSLITQETSDSLDRHYRQGGNLNPLMRQRVGFFKQDRRI